MNRAVTCKNIETRPLHAWTIPHN
uniref:Uncharacterized protein n=1 Tax=Arundo donax TaxID=35708 RepID=A0A0A9EGP2_ARUDO